MSNYLTVPTPGLPAQIAAAMTIETAPLYGADGQFDGVTVASAKLVGQHSEATIREALVRVTASCQPGGIEHATKALGILRAKTASRPGQDIDLVVAGAAFAPDLARYPRDVIEEGIRRYADSNRWWPAWADLKRECDRLVAKRLAERTALQDALKPKVEPLYLGKPVPLSRAERIQIGINAWIRNGRQDRAAPLERELAAAEKREPQEWAKPQPAQPSNLAERPPFVPSTSPTSKRMAELAEEFRAKQAAERAAIYTTQAAE